jgi:hypothetical protein
MSMTHYCSAGDGWSRQLVWRPSQLCSIQPPEMANNEQQFGGFHQWTRHVTAAADWEFVKMFTQSGLLRIKLVSQNSLPQSYFSSSFFHKYSCVKTDA